MCLINQTTLKCNLAHKHWWSQIPEKDSGPNSNLILQELASKRGTDGYKTLCGGQRLQDGFVLRWDLIARETRANTIHGPVLSW